MTATGHFLTPVTAQLVQRLFVLEVLGLHELKGVAEPMPLYSVVEPREVDHDNHEAMLAGDFDALVGRDEEIGLLLRRWEQSKEGLGQVVLLGGEAGKSVQRTLDWQSDDTGDTNLAKPEQALERTRLVLKEAVLLMASLLSLELPEDRYPARTLSPPQLRQQNLIRQERQHHQHGKLMGYTFF